MYSVYACSVECVCTVKLMCHGSTQGAIMAHKKPAIYDSIFQVLLKTALVMSAIIAQHLAATFKHNGRISAINNQLLYGLTVRLNDFQCVMTVHNKCKKVHSNIVRFCT